MAMVPHIYHLLPAVLMGGDLPPQCGVPPDKGDSSCGKQKSLKFHFDASTGFCMNFRYDGCGGNENRFDDLAACITGCLKYNYKGCPFQRNPLIPLKCSNHASCNRQAGRSSALYCTREGICCETKDLEELRLAFNVACPEGEHKAMYTYQSTTRLLIGKTCESRFCPESASCHSNKHFSYCCLKQ